MFVIFQGVLAVHGPSDWNKLRFQDVIQDEFDIAIALTNNNDAREAIEVDAGLNVKILPVVALDVPSHNPKIEFLQGPFYNVYATSAEMYYVVENKNIDTVRSELKTIVAENRWRAEVAGVPVNIQGQTITAYTDRESRNIFFQAAMLGADNVNWKFPEGFWTLTATDILTIVTAIKSHVQSCFDWETSTNASIESASTHALLNEIVLEYGV